MKTKCIALFIILFSLSFVYSNEKEVFSQTSLKTNFSFNVLKNTNIVEQIISYNDDGNKMPILTKGNSIGLIISGGVLLGEGVLSTGLGGACVGLFYFFKDYSSLAPAYIVLAGISFALGGISLIAGVILLSIGIYTYTKYYKDKKVTLFIDSKDNKNNFGLSFKI